MSAADEAHFSSRNLPNAAAQCGAASHRFHKNAVLSRLHAILLAAHDLSILDEAGNMLSSDSRSSDPDSYMHTLPRFQTVVCG